MKAVKANKRKKTKRDFTNVNSMKHFIEKFALNGDKIIYKYYDINKELSEMSYAEFSKLIEHEAAGLHALGLDGKRIAIIGETSPYWVATYIASIAMGGVAIPMDKELEVSEIEGFLEFAEADAVVFSKLFNQKFDGAARNHPTVKHFIAIDSSQCTFTDADSFIAYDNVIEFGRKAIEEGYTVPEPVDMERMAVMLFTSGTTGTSKCVMLSEKNVCAAINSACECVEFFPDDRIVSVLPIHHTYELCCMLGGANYGMEICINDSLRKVLKNFALFQPTGLVLVPLFVNTMYKKIIDTAKKQNQYGKLKKGMVLSRAMRKVGIDVRRKLFASVNDAFGGRLVKIVCGGAPLNPQMVKEFEEFGIYIAEGYGITECSPLVAANPYFASKPGSVGPAVNCCTARIDPEGYINDNGYLEGEIQVKGDNVMLGYYKDPEGTAAAFTEDGYFRTGDIGYIDEDGYIFITGRSKFVIVLENGKNVFPEEIEEYLGRIDEIAESVVLGRKAEDGESVILTAICYPNYEALNGETDPEKVKEIVEQRIAQLNKKLVGYKRIRKVEIRETEFEKTTSKKIKRNLVQ